MLSSVFSFMAVAPAKIIFKKHLKKESVSVKVPSILQASSSPIHYGKDSPRKNRSCLTKQNLLRLKLLFLPG